MSTFNGFIEEIQGISIDSFELRNMNSTVFFLSHCHTDHMHGLSWNYAQIIEKPDAYLYASPVSVAILKSKYPSLAPKLKALDIMRPTAINIPPDSERLISVKVIPAGHCPGSVMFLFEIEDSRNILYTGDFRLNVGELEKFNQFHNSFGEIIKIEKMYLDTTFMNDTYRRLPPREDCVDEICERIKEWISLSKENIIEIVNSAYYGSEFLYIEIFKRIGMPIHMSKTLYDEYKHFPEMDKIGTLSKETQIHCSCVKFRGICTTRNVRKIIPSAFYWKTEVLEQKEKLVHNYNEFRFCYSCHPSLEETIEFIKFLKPKVISANVLPKQREKAEKLLNLIEETIASYTEVPSDAPKELFSLENLEYNEAIKRSSLESKSKTNRNNLKLDEDLLSSPPRTFKRAKESITP